MLQKMSAHMILAPDPEDAAPLHMEHVGHPNVRSLLPGATFGEAMILYLLGQLALGIAIATSLSHH